MSSQTPVAFSIFAAVLRAKNCTIKVFDTTFYKTGTSKPNEKKSEMLIAKPFSFKKRHIGIKEGDVYKDFLKMVADFKPNLIAVSMTEDTFRLGLSLLKVLGDERPPTIAGGVFPTSAPEVVINYQEFDMVCVGEGEKTLLEVCETMAADGDVSNIPNLYFLKDGSIYKNPIRPVIDLNTLPIPYLDCFDPDLFYRPMDGDVYKFICVEIQRGCPYTCTYCNSPTSIILYKQGNAGYFFRRKSPKNILEEFDYLISKWQPEYIYMVADNFLMMPGREFKEFAEGYMKYKIPFWCNTRAETITIEKMELLKKMNCRRLNIGIEHGNEEFRREVVGRSVTNEKLVEAFKIAHASGVPVVANNIIGFPDETRDLIFDTIQFTRSIRKYVVDAGAFIFAPYHGTPLREVCVNKGYIPYDLIVSGDITSGVLLKQPHITSDELKGLARTFPFYVTMPVEEYDLIKKAERFDEEGNRIYNMLKEKYQGGTRNSISSSFPHANPKNLLSADSSTH